MTKEQYKETIKAIMECTTKALAEVKTNEEKINIMEAQNNQIRAITESFMK